MTYTSRTALSLQKFTTLLTIASLFLVISLHATSANPIASWPNDHSKSDKPQDECGLRGETQIQALCQRCAKSTRSPMVYPMCCENREDARQWCQRYMGFGIHSDDTRRHNMDT